MPGSSRSKSHEESKHSSRECDDFDIRVSKDSLISGGKRKLFENGNDEFSKTTKPRKHKIGGDDGEVVNIDVKKLKPKDLLKDVGYSKKAKRNMIKNVGEKRSQVKENKSGKEKKVENQAKKRGRVDNGRRAYPICRLRP